MQMSPRFDVLIGESGYWKDGKQKSLTVIFLRLLGYFPPHNFQQKKNSGVPDEFYVIFSIHFQIEYSVYILELSLKDIFLREDEF